MSRRFTAHNAYHLVNENIEVLEKKINKIQKEFNDMDFENADARNEMETVINNMKSTCRRLINELSSYHFT